MNRENWQLWQKPRKRMHEARLLRYGLAVILPLAASWFVFIRPTFTEAPYFIFLVAVVLSVINGGLAPAAVSAALSAVLLRLLFVGPKGGLHFGRDFEGMERMGVFVLLALMLSSLVAGVRRERNQLRDSEERYRLLAESASDAIIVIDELGEILYLNAAAEKTFGTSAGALLCRNLNLLLSGDRYQAQLTELKQRLDTRKQPVAVKLPGRHQSGEAILIEMTLGSSCHRGRNIFTAIIRDITTPTR